MTGAPGLRLAGLVLMLGLAACADLDPRKSGDRWDAERVAAMPAPEDPRLAQLFEGYIGLSRAELAEYDWNDGADFLAKAETAAMGTLPPHFALDQRRIGKAQRAEFAAAEAEMLALFAARGAQLRAPREIAQVQIDWECWLQESEEGYQTDEIELCREAFNTSLARAKEAARLPKQLVVVLPEEDGSIGGVVLSIAGGGDLVLDKPFAAGSDSGAVAVGEGEIREAFSSALSARPIAPSFFKVLFDSGSSRINPAGMDVVQKVVADIRARPVAEVVLIGHADALGGDAANTRLSRRRARAIRAAITAELDTADEVEFEIDGLGERALEIPTQGNEPGNRRVEVTVR